MQRVKLLKTSYLGEIQMTRNVKYPNLIAHHSQSYCRCCSVTPREPRVMVLARVMVVYRAMVLARVMSSLRGSHVLSAHRVGRTKSIGPKGLQLEVGARRAPRLVV